MALAALVVGVLLLTLVLFGACTTAMALSEGEPLVWPAPADLAAAAGAGLLVLERWAPAGCFLGAVARGPALSVGLGLLGPVAAARSPPTWWCW